MAGLKARPSSAGPAKLRLDAPVVTRSAADWRREFDADARAGIDGIIPEVYNGRQTLFRSTRLPVRAPWLETAIPIAARRRPRSARVDVVHAVSHRRVIKQHPDWYNVNAKGESAVDKPAYVDYYKFLDPARPEVREFVRDTVRELAAIPGLTGIHLDYIRHPDAILPSGLWSKYGIVQDKVLSAVRLRLHRVQPARVQGEARRRSDRVEGSREPTASGCSTGSTRSSIS